MSPRGFGIRRPGWLLLVGRPGAGLLAPEAASAHAQAAAPIRVSYQPATYWSLPFLVAIERGFWRRKASSPSCCPFRTGPQVDAGAKEAWDVGAMGSAPAVLAASRFGLLTIGITNDESLANAVMVRGDAAATWLKRPARDLRGKTVMVTRSSTGEYVLRAYLESLELTEKAVKVLYMDQTAIVKAFAGKGGDVFVLWAPYLYVALSRGGKVLANGRSAGLMVPGALVALSPIRARASRRGGALPPRLSQSARVAAGQPRGGARHPGEVQRAGGHQARQALVRGGLQERPVWGLAGQLGLLSRPRDGPSIADRMVRRGRGGVRRVGRLQENPDPTALASPTST